MPTLVTMPKWGLTMTTGTVTGWNVGEGDEVNAGHPLLTVETEKAVNDIEAPADGVLLKIVADAGAEVPVMGPVAVIAAPGETVSDEEMAALLAGAAPATGTAAPGARGAGPARAARPAARDASGRVNASPAARKRAGELGIDLATVEATGPGGRVTSEDVERAATAAASTESEPREERVTLADGREIAALVAGAPDAADRIVFLHGLSGSQSTWSTVLAGLVDRYRVAALDLPGHGKSDRRPPEETDYAIPGLASAVGEAIAGLGLAPAVVVGHSLGGAVAMQLAFDRPKLVRALVLVDSAGLGTEVSPDLLDRIEAAPSRDEARKLLALFFEDKRLVLDRGVDEMYQARMDTQADAAVRAVAAAAFNRDGQRSGLEARLGELAAPTFVISGELDRVFPVAQAVAAQETIPGAWLEVLEGIGHVPQVEAAPRLTALIETFVSSLLPVPDDLAAPDEPAAESAPTVAAADESVPTAATAASAPSDAPVERADDGAPLAGPATVAETDSQGESDAAAPAAEGTDPTADAETEAASASAETDSVAAETAAEPSPTPTVDIAVPAAPGVDAAPAKPDAETAPVPVPGEADSAADADETTANATNDGTATAKDAGTGAGAG